MIDYSDWGEKPVPQVDVDSREFWEVAAEGRLVVQRCGECGECQHYPRRLCRHCWSRDLAMEELPGSGTVYSYTECHVGGQPGYEEETPYLVALVELDLPAENPSGRPVRLTSHVLGEDVDIGMAVDVAFRAVSVDPEIHLPVFEVEG